LCDLLGIHLLEKPLLGPTSESRQVIETAVENWPNVLGVWRDSLDVQPIRVHALTRHCGKSQGGGISPARLERVVPAAAPHPPGADRSGDAMNPGVP
jgi:hypothetical protein